jgi:uncharacterized membrane protein
MDVLFAVAAFGVATTAPMDGSQSSELALLTETKDGDYVSADYPTQPQIGQSEQLVVSVENHESEWTAYSVVLVQRMVKDGDTIEAERLATHRETVDPGETWYQPHEIEPADGLVDSNQRLTYLLYRGEPPADPTVENAYRTVWITVDVIDGPPE